MTIRDFIIIWTKRFSDAGIPSARLDAELILMRAGNFSREFLFAHDEEKLNFREKIIANRFAKKREKRIPLAYIFREKEFYGRNFYVNKNVLIPRPETEELINESMSRLNQNSAKNILEIGTGSGIISMTIACNVMEKSTNKIGDFRIFATEISRKALRVARKNSRKVTNSKKSIVSFLQSDLLENVNEKFDLIVANLPYVSRNWNVEINSPELNSEPELALFADDNGNALNKKLIQQIAKKQTLVNGGFLILEMDPEQLDAISIFAKKYGFAEFSRKPYVLTLKKLDK